MPQGGTRVVGLPVAYGLETFRDRVAERDFVLDALGRPGTRLVTITGRRGIGKSALAAKVAEQLAAGDEESYGVVNLSSRTSGISLERIFLDAARLLPDAEEARLQQVWSGGRATAEKMLDLFASLSHRHCLIVLDNLEDHLADDGRVQDDDLTLLLDVVMRAPRPPKLLITSQVPPSLPAGARRYEARLRLDEGLPTDEAVDLLRDLDRNGVAALVEASPDQLARMARKVHGIPRALELVVAAMSDDYLTMPSLDEMLTSFARRGDIVAGLAQDRYHRLDAQARIVMDVLAVFRRPTTVDAVAWALRPIAPAVDVGPALAALASTHMATLDRATRTFVLHPLDADLVHGGLPETGPLGRRSLERRAAQWYLHDAPDESQWTVIDDVAAHRWAFLHLVKADDHVPAALLLDQIDDFMVWHGSTASVIEMHADLEGRLDGDADARLGHLLGYGFARTIGGPVAAAVPLLEQAETLARADGDRRKVERALRLLTGAYRPAGRLEQAVTAGLAAADLAHELGNAHHESHSLINVSLALSYQGDLAGALRTADRLHTLGTERDDPLVVARAHNATAAAHLAGREWVAAGEHATASIAAYERSGTAEAIGYARNMLGLAQLGTGDAATAEVTFHIGLDEGYASEQPRVEGFCRYNLAWSYWTTARFEEALGETQLSLQAFERAGSAERSAAAALARAASAMCSDDPVDVVAAALRDAARAVGRHPDLCPADWLVAAADHLEAGPAA